MSVRVLLVDDHDDARTTLARRLSRDRRLELIGAAASLKDAANLLPDAQPDIVLLDMHGLGQHGVDACRTLRSLTDAPVVAFASFMTPELWAAAREAGAVAYLLKHIDTERISRELVRLAERHRGGTDPHVGGHNSPNGGEGDTPDDES